MSSSLNFHSSKVLNCPAFIWQVTRHASAKQKSKNQKDTKDPFIVVRPRKCDYPDILKFMRRNYYREEPTYSSIGFQPNAVTDNQIIKALGEGISLLAKCRCDGEIVGACINESTNPWDPMLKDRLACLIKCPKTRRLFAFFAHLQRMPNIWERYHALKVFEMSQVAVKKDERRQGLAIRLMEESRRLAWDCSYAIIRVDATSHYTSLICEKMGMEQICAIPYDSYVDQNEEPVFQPLEPHKVVKVYVDATQRKL